MSIAATIAKNQDKLIAKVKKLAASGATFVAPSELLGALNSKAKKKKGKAVKVKKTKQPLPSALPRMIL